MKGDITLARYSVRFVLILALALLVLPAFAYADPDGGNITALGTERGPSNHNANSTAAYAGNVTQMDIYGITNTQGWQGYFGNVSGVIQLSDATDHAMYNWSLASPQGEVLASTNSSIYWSGIQCFNFSATQLYTGPSGASGGTNLDGLNESGLEIRYGFAHGGWNNSVDGVAETFPESNVHRNFYVAGQQFSPGECRSSSLYDNTGASVTNHFTEVLQWEPTTSSVIFTSLIEDNRAGFDTGLHDFEMMVLDDGHGTDINPTTYYFFVELE